MSRIFKKQQDYVKKPNRNNFDLSFNNNFTTKFGQLLPILCKEVNPGDRFRIDTSLGIRALPLAFPIQTPVQAHVAFFYCRNRTLWKNWMDFYGRTKDNLVHPYISIPYTRAKEIGTGTLADYLGVPTTYSNDSQIYKEAYKLYGLEEVNTIPQSSFGLVTDYSTVYENNEGVVTSSQTVSDVRVNTGSVVTQRALVPFAMEYGTLPNRGDLLGSRVTSGTPNTLRTGLITGGQLPMFIESPSPKNFVPTTLTDVKVHVYTDNDGIFLNSRYYGTMNGSMVVSNDRYIFTPNNSLDSPGVPYYLVFEGAALEGNLLRILISPNGAQSAFGSSIIGSFQSVGVQDASSLSNPFVIQEGEQFPDIRLNALPFRAYEQIYNCYYRNEINDPFILNGQPEYNRYITNDGDGADSTTPLFLRSRNYELDFLTSAVNSPQQGVAPLVGVSSTGEFTFEDENGNTFKVKPKVGEDGNTLTGIDSYDPDIPQGSLFHLKDMIKYGISINDFRNVNSLQRWLETNIRRGYKYKDQILSHFGVNVRYDELDMAEYCGGFNRTLTVQQINATAETSEMKLGDYAGQMGLFSKSSHSINRYFDEPGFLIGILCLVPIPNYSQLLSKHMIKDSVLSYHFPEFNHIGYQPIDYKEVTPIQAKVAGKDYNDTFGYQRPYYDLIASVDENHGLFRTELQGFIISRNFGQPPLLGHDFLVIDPDDMTNPFVETTENRDTFMGQVFFDIKAKRSISKIHIPRLE